MPFTAAPAAQPPPPQIFQRCVVFIFNILECWTPPIMRHLLQQYIAGVGRRALLRVNTWAQYYVGFSIDSQVIERIPDWALMYGFKLGWHVLVKLFNAIWSPSTVALLDQEDRDDIARFALYNLLRED